MTKWCCLQTHVRAAHERPGCCQRCIAQLRLVTRQHVTFTTTARAEGHDRAHGPALSHPEGQATQPDSQAAETESVVKQDAPPSAGPMPPTHVRRVRSPAVRRADNSSLQLQEWRKMYWTTRMPRTPQRSGDLHAGSTLARRPHSASWRLQDQPPRRPQVCVPGLCLGQHFGHDHTRQGAPLLAKQNISSDSCNLAQQCVSSFCDHLADWGPGC